MGAAGLIQRDDDSHRESDMPGSAASLDSRQTWQVFEISRGQRRTEHTGRPSAKCGERDGLPDGFHDTTPLSERLNKLSSNSHPDVRKVCRAISREKSRRTGLHAADMALLAPCRGDFPIMDARLLQRPAKCAAPSTDSIARTASVMCAVSLASPLKRLSLDPCG